jgi:hypothetical protein
MAKTQDIEPELTQPVPRPTRRRGGMAVGCGLWFIRLFLLPHTLGGLAILFAAVVGTFSYLGVALSGVEMEGRITRKTEVKARKGKKITYTLYYAYTVEGLEYAGNDTVSKEEYAARKEGQAIPLRVVPWAPLAHWTRLPGSSPGVSLVGYWAGALFWNGIMMLFLWVLWIQPWQQWRLVRWGVPTLGIVRDVKTTPMKRGYSYTVHYEYTSVPVDYEPEQLLTSSVSSHTEEARAIKKGDVLTVLHDPKRPQRSIPYKLADFEAKMV